MTISKVISKLRSDTKLSQEQFAAIFGVSQQSVQKWENGDSVPELSKLIKISKYFGISLDALVMGSDGRMIEEMRGTKQIKPQYANRHKWESYASDLATVTEYQQSMEEGLDIEQYKDLFYAVSRYPENEIRKKLGDVLFDIVTTAPMREGYPYVEPSDLESIKALRRPYRWEKKSCVSEEKIHGAWLGRISGCMLGKPVECAKTNELIPFLKDMNNYPLHRYLHRSELTDEITNKYNYPFASREYIDTSDGMPVDDDTNYTVLYQEVIEKYGRDFTPYDVAQVWLAMQPKDAYCTAERVAFCNFIKGYLPPQSAVYKNPYREWIGAQIRADYFGYINPGNPEMAAEMAWRDATVSHVKNGIYGEMWVAAMLAIAAETDDLEEIILGGLAQIPYTSRLYEEVMMVYDAWKGGMPQKDCFAMIHKQYDEYSQHGWCHTNSNAMIVAASLLYGRGDFGKAICMSVETGFDTDCNGATVGSVYGMAFGLSNIPETWTAPFHDKLNTSIFGVGQVRISDRVKLTMKHIGEI